MDTGLPCVVWCSYSSMLTALTMHLIALYEILVILEVPGRICDIRLDIIIQIPAEILI